MTSSGYLFIENQNMEHQLTAVTHEAEMLDAEVPDPIIKYSPLLVNSDDPKLKELAASFGFDRWDLPSYYFEYNAKPYMEFNDDFVEISRDEHSHMKIRHS